MSNRAQQEKQFWDAYAERYDHFVQKRASGYYEVLIEKMMEDVTGTEHLLEIGTGTGTLSLGLRQRIPRITATDLSPEMIRIAGQKAKDQNDAHIELKVEDACNLSFPDKSFDTVLAANVLHLLFDPDKAMLEMKRVLKDGGVIIVPTYCHGQNPISHLASRMMSLLTHRGFKARSRWSVDGFSDFVLRQGFHVKRKVVIRGVIPMVYLVAVLDQSKPIKQINKDNNKASPLIARPL